MTQGPDMFTSFGRAAPGELVVASGLLHRIAIASPAAGPLARPAARQTS